MDIAAAGAAASQISTAQRTQQAALAGIRQARVQGATLANLLSQATPASSTPSANASDTVSTSINSSNDNLASADQPSRNLPRGSLVNILV
jgi:hypothetical protein